MHRFLWSVGVMGWSFACAGSTAAPPARVQPGLEVLLEDSLHLVRGLRVGLVSNQGAVDAAGAHAVERLRAKGVNLVALFSPEHGFRGTAAPGAAVGSSRDSATGLPIYSLYGRTTSPADSTLDGIDVILVDLPDVGARYYTYLSTTVEVMRAAARRGIPVVVLDRPDPVGGAVQGNVLDTAARSFVGLLAVPMRHGLTLGELALLAQHDLAIGSRLTVVPARGWHRSQYLDETGLPFVRPSPNLTSLESLIHYPGLCLFEGTNLSVGRGSEAPFEQIGAPWLDTTRVLAELRSAGIPGLELRSTRFTPNQPGDGKYPDTLLVGIRFRVTDRDRYDPTLAAVTTLGVLLRVHPREFAWLAPHFDRLAGGPALRLALTRGDSAAAIAASWAPAQAEYRQRRESFLLYR